MPIETEITLTLTAGEHISRATERACDLVRRHGMPVRFTFNGVDLVANDGSTP